MNASKKLYTAPVLNANGGMLVKTQAFLPKDIKEANGTRTKP
jgi:hypothetical protein